METMMKKEIVGTAEATKTAPHTHPVILKGKFKREEAREPEHKRKERERKYAHR
jgi:hypothetical protein